MNKQDAIAEAAIRTLIAKGAAGLTVARIARAARVSSALVHYHFTTKRKLLARAAERLAVLRTAGRLEPLASGRGLDCLDALWRNLVEGVGGGAERAWHDLALLARDDLQIRLVLLRERDREKTAAASALGRLLESLGSRPQLAAEDLAAVVITFLDGIALALDSGSQDGEVRAAYDAFWLALVALGQAAPAR